MAKPPSSKRIRPKTFAEFRGNACQLEGYILATPKYWVGKKYGRAQHQASCRIRVMEILPKHPKQPVVATYLHLKGYDSVAQKMKLYLRGKQWVYVTGTIRHYGSKAPFAQRNNESFFYIQVLTMKFRDAAGQEDHTVTITRNELDDLLRARRQLERIDPDYRFALPESTIKEMEGFFSADDDPNYEGPQVDWKEEAARMEELNDPNPEGPKDPEEPSHDE